MPSTARFSSPADSKLVLWGLTVWLAVYLLIRVGGTVLLDPANPLVLGAFVVSIVPAMALVTFPVYWRLGVGYGMRARAAAIMSLPGLFLDGVLVAFAPVFLPALTPALVVNFGAILLYGYAIVLLTGFVPRGH